MEGSTWWGVRDGSASHFQGAHERRRGHPESRVVQGSLQGQVERLVGDTPVAVLAGDFSSCPKVHTEPSQGNLTWQTAP